MSAKPLQLSHTAVEKYLKCPKSYHYHYIQRIRETKVGSALIFGSAVDAGLNMLLKSNDVAAALLAFTEAFSRGFINGEKVDYRDSPLINYKPYDFDPDIIMPDDRALILEKACVNTMAEAFSLIEDKKNGMQFFYWASLKAKGMFLIESYNRQVRPHIKTVIEVQSEKRFVSPRTGTSILMFPDLVCEWEDGSIVVLDHKTSSFPYEPEKVLTSAQLALYTYRVMKERNTKNVRSGFIVLPKKPGKIRDKACTRCGLITQSRHKTCAANTVEGKRCDGEFTESLTFTWDVQILIDSIPARTIWHTMKSFKKVEKGVMAGDFSRNTNGCIGVYGKCPYYNKCWHASDAGLTHVESSGRR